MKRTIIVLILTLAVWSYPLKTAGAVLTPQNEEQPFINYEAIREKQTPQHKPTSGTRAIKVQTEVNGRDYSGKIYSKEEVQQLIRDYSNLYGIDPQTPLCIAKLESGYNQFSKNQSSSASGVFQYLASTWKATDEGKAGLSVFDADANVRAAVKYMAVHKKTTPWVVHSKCPTLKFIN